MNNKIEYINDYIKYGLISSISLKIKDDGFKTEQFYLFNSLNDENYF